MVKHFIYVRWIIVISSVIFTACLYTYIAIYLNNAELYQSISGLLNTVLATSISICTAVFIYYRQLKDQLVSKLESVICILKAVKNDIDTALNNEENHSANYFIKKKDYTLYYYKSIVTNAIDSGYFSDEANNLIFCTDCIESFYDSAIKRIGDLDNDNNHNNYDPEKVLIENYALYINFNIRLFEKSRRGI